MVEHGGIFLLRPGALGDTLLLAPALAALRARWPSSRVILAGYGRATHLLADSGLIDVPLSRDDPRLAALFGSASDLTPLRSLLGPTTAAVAWLSDPDGVVAANLRRLGAPLVAVDPSQPEAGGGRHVAVHLCDTLVRNGLVPAGALPLPPLLRTPSSETVWVDDFLAVPARRGCPLVAVHPGSGGRRKNWPAASFAQVVDRLAASCTVVLIGGPADEEQLAAVRSGVRSEVVLANDLPLPRVAALLARCVAYLGNDSGLTHLAALLGVPTVALFGPTDPALWCPWGGRSKVLRFSGGPEVLTPDEVAAAVQAQLRIG